MFLFPRIVTKFCMKEIETLVGHVKICFSYLAVLVPACDVLPHESPLSHAMSPERTCLNVHEIYYACILRAPASISQMFLAFYNGTLMQS